jgi:hypothetical protein
MYLAAENSLLQCWIVHEMTCFVHDARVSNRRVQHLHEFAGHLFTACVAVDTITAYFFRYECLTYYIVLNFNKLALKGALRSYRLPLSIWLI